MLLGTGAVKLAIQTFKKLKLVANLQDSVMQMQITILIRNKEKLNAVWIA